ncbi:MAG: hypothetical protein KDC38_17535 [Planctomycetes bacterium]|nr:hypothetical protein [Planctomycetota bacterium]
MHNVFWGTLLVLGGWNGVSALGVEPHAWNPGPSSVFGPGTCASMGQVRHVRFSDCPCHYELLQDVIVPAGNIGSFEITAGGQIVGGADYPGSFTLVANLTLAGGQDFRIRVTCDAGGSGSPHLVLTQTGVCSGPCGDDDDGSAGGGEGAGQ